MYTLYMTRVGQNRIYTPYTTVYLVISLPKIPYVHRIYMVLANPIYDRISGDFPAKKTVCTPFIFMVLASSNYCLC